MDDYTSLIRSRISEVDTRIDALTAELVANRDRAEAIHRELRAAYGLRSELLAELTKPSTETKKELSARIRARKERR